MTSHVSDERPIAHPNSRPFALVHDNVQTCFMGCRAIPVSIVGRFQAHSMAKKKKAALKPVARGFATTSQPKKIVPEPESEAVTDPEDDASKTEIHNAVSGADGSGGVCNGKVAEGLDWEDDSKLEEGIYQGYVERLQEKGDREVAKILKVSSKSKTTILVGSHVNARGS